MARISVSYTLSSLVTVVATVTSVTASADYIAASYDTAGASTSYSYEIIDTRPLPAEDVYLIDSSYRIINTPKDDDNITMSDSDTKEINLAPTDSVTAQESLFKVVTNPIDFDPSDDDVDPTPVTMVDSDAKEVTVGELADNDDVTMGESTAKNPEKPGITASVSTSEAINQFRPVKNVTDTTTTSEAIDRFDVTTEFDDTVTVTETSAKTITPAGKTDSVIMSGDNIKAFNSSVDFDPSDDDVDPDPITASDAINSFESDLGKADSITIAESDAKNLTRPSVADTATASDAAALDTEVPKSDSVTAVEGIKNNPSKPLTDTATLSDDKVLDIRPSYTDTLSVIESIVTNLILGESSYLYPQFAYASDGVDTPYLRGYHRGIAVDYATQSTDDGWQTNGEYMMFNEGFLGGPGGLATQWYGLEFTQDAFRFRDTDYEAQVNGGHLEMNYTFMHGTAVDDIKTLENTGVIGAAERLNNAIINADTITYGVLTNAGLVVNFMYTDTEDTSCGGHYINETPLCAGAYSL